MMRNNLPLDIDENDDETSFDDTNDFTGRNDRFLYARMLNTIPDIREKSNLKKYTFVAIILSLFFMSIILFTYLETRSNKTEEINSTKIYNKTEEINTAKIYNKTEEINTTKMYNKTEEINTTKMYNKTEEINTTKIYGEHNNETVTENIVKVDKFNTSISDNNPSNFITTEIIYTVPKFNHTENNIEITKDNFLITNEQLNLTKKCLERVVSSVEDVKTIQDLKKCKLNPGPILTKTKIRFVMGNTLLFLCLVYARPCNYLYEVETHTHIVSHGLKDLYFNYVLGPGGDLYEGRSLNCLFDENILAGDHSTVLVVGMPDCKFLDDEKEWEKQGFFNILKYLLNCLENNGILNSNYTMEFDMTCKNFLILEDILSLYHDKIVLLGDDSLEIEKIFKNYTEVRINSF